MLVLLECGGMVDGLVESLVLLFELVDHGDQLECLLLPLLLDLLDLLLEAFAFVAPLGLLHLEATAAEAQLAQLVVLLLVANGQVLEHFEHLDDLGHEVLENVGAMLVDDLLQLAADHRGELVDVG